MGKKFLRWNKRRPEAGISMIETLMAAGILVIGSIGMLSLIVTAIATNNRNKMDSTQTMLAESILEQLNSTFGPSAGPGTSSLKDCAGNSFSVDTTDASGSGSYGAPLNGTMVDYSAAAPAGWQMDYVMTSPCYSTAATVGAYTILGTYDVRWHLERIGSGGTATQSYIITVSAKLKGKGATDVGSISGQNQGLRYFALPVTLRVMYGS